MQLGKSQMGIADQKNGIMSKYGGTARLFQP